MGVAWVSDIGTGSSSSGKTVYYFINGGGEPSLHVDITPHIAQKKRKPVRTSFSEAGEVIVETPLVTDSS